MLFLECIVLIALSKITLFLIHIIRSHYNLIHYFKLIYYLFWYIILSYFLHFISTSITLYYCCCDCPYYVKHLEISLYFKVCYTNKIHYYYYYYTVNATKEQGEIAQETSKSSCMIEVNLIMIIFM